MFSTLASKLSNDEQNALEQDLRIDRQQHQRLKWTPSVTIIISKHHRKILAHVQEAPF